MQWYVFSRTWRAPLGAIAFALLVTFGSACKPSIITAGLSAASNMSGATTPDGVIVTSISASPADGAIAAGSTVTLTGSGFTSDLQVTINGVSCSPVTVPSSTLLTCIATATIPAGGPIIVVTKASSSSSSSGSLGGSASTSSPAPAPAPAPAPPPANLPPTATGLRCPAAVVGTPYNAFFCNFSALSDDGGLSGLTITKASGTTCSFLTSASRNSEHADLTGTAPGGGAGTTCDIALAVSDGTNTVTASTTITIGTAITVNANVTITSANVATFTHNAVTVQTGRTVTVDDTTPITLAALDLQGTAIMTHTACTTTSCKNVDLRINGPVTIGASAAIHGDAKGYLGGGATGPDTVVNPSSNGRTYPNSATGGAPAEGTRHGGSHGGRGGRSNFASGVNTSLVYGSITAPSTHGGGGNHPGAAQYGGPGGGAIHVDALTMTLDGRISANGGNGPDATYSPGGAGGSVWVEVDTLTSSGTGCAGTGGCLRVNGSNGPTDATYGAPGGGGRLALYYRTLTGFSTSNAYVQAFGGNGPGTYEGSAGTVFLKTPSDTYGRLVLDNNSVTPFYETIYDITGAVTAVTATTLSTGSLLLLTNSLAGKTLFPNLDNLSVSCTITSNTVSTLTVSGCDPSATSAVGKVFWVADTHSRFDAVTIKGATKASFSRLTVTNSGATGALALADAVTYLTTPGSTTVGTGSLVIAADSMDVGINSKVDVSGRGYLGGGQTGFDGVNHVSLSGMTYPNTITGGSQTPLRSGGSHGGRGGFCTHSTRGESGRVYGSITQPSTAGGGGSNPGSGQTGGAGGGILKITASSLTVNGIITADGGPLPDTSLSQGGAGGSIWISTSTLSSTGTGCAGTGGCIRANGADGGSDVNYGSPGGGGRIAIYRTTLSGFAINGTNVQAYGGNGTSAFKGGAGTIYSKTPSQTYGSLLIDNNSLSPGFETVYDASGYVTAVTATTLSTSNIYVVNALTGKTLVPNVENPGTTCTIASNTAMVITVSGCDPSALSAVSKFYAVTDYNAQFDSILVSGSAKGIVHHWKAQNAAANASLQLSSSASLAAWPATTVGFAPIKLYADTLTVDAGTTLHANGRGYFGGYAATGPDGVQLISTTGQTNGGTTAGGSTFYSGASHGGRGGAGSTGAAGSEYGSYLTPTLPGAGGGSGTTSVVYGGGSGGGVIYLNTTTLAHNGTISANGDGGLTTAATGGAGGSVYIETGALTTTGAPVIRANGHAGGTDAAPAGGGGGRVAVYYNTTNYTFSNTTIQAFGGADGTRNASAGSVFYKQNSANGNYLCDNNGTTGEPSSYLTLPSATTWLTLVSSNSCELYMNNNGNGLTVTGSTTLASGTFTRPSAVSCSFAGPDTPSTY